MRPAALLIAVLAVLAVLALVGCDEPASTPTPDAEPIGELKYAIESDVRTVPFSHVECAAKGEFERIEIFAARDVPHAQGAGKPRILIARLRGDDVKEAYAFIPQVTFHGEDYQMLQLAAADIDGGSDTWACRIEPAEQNRRLACNDTHVMPWLTSREPPPGSFTVEFACP